MVLCHGDALCSLWGRNWELRHVYWLVFSPAEARVRCLWWTIGWVSLPVLRFFPCHYPSTDAPYSFSSQYYLMRTSAPSLRTHKQSCALDCKVWACKPAIKLKCITFRGPRVFVRQYIDQSHLSNRLPVRLVSRLGPPMRSWRLCSNFTDYMTQTWRLPSMQDRVSSAPYGLPYWQGVWEFANSLAAITRRKHFGVICLILSFWRDLGVFIFLTA